MKRILIYGISQQAEQLCRYIQLEQAAEIRAFVADQQYKTRDSLNGIPVVSFDDLGDFSPQDYEIAISFGCKNMVENRRAKAEACMRRGYSIYTFISSHAQVYADSVGEGCIIYPGCVVSAFTRLGRGNFLEVGATIAHHTVVGNYNFFAPSATVCGGVTIEDNCFFGANCTVSNNITVRHKTLVSAGCFLNRCSQPHEVYFSEQAKRSELSSEQITI